MAACVKYVAVGALITEEGGPTEATCGDGDGAPGGAIRAGTGALASPAAGKPNLTGTAVLEDGPVAAGFLLSISTAAAPPSAICSGRGFAVMNDPAYTSFPVDAACGAVAAAATSCIVDGAGSLCGRGTAAVEVVTR